MTYINGKRYDQVGECFECRTGEVVLNTTVERLQFMAQHGAHLLADWHFREQI